MQKRPQVFAVLTVAGSVLWLGGLVRLFGEAAGRIVSTVRPARVDAPFWISVGLSGALAIGVLIAMLPWYRRFYRQTRADMAATRGIPAESRPPRRADLRRSVKVILVVLGGAVVIALLLPGLIAAALAVVAGLVLRTSAAVVAGTSTSGPASDPPVGGIYRWDSDASSYAVMKVIAVDNDAIHVRMYSNRYAEPPTTLPGGLELIGFGQDLLQRKEREGPVEIEPNIGIGHVPISRPGFYGTPGLTLIGVAPVTPAELEGYELWRDHGGGVFG